MRGHEPLCLYFKIGKRESPKATFGWMTFKDFFALPGSEVCLERGKFDFITRKHFFPHEDHDLALFALGERQIGEEEMNLILDELNSFWNSEINGIVLSKEQIVDKYDEACDFYDFRIYAGYTLKCSDGDYKRRAEMS